MGPASDSAVRVRGRDITARLKSSARLPKAWRIFSAEPTSFSCTPSRCRSGARTPTSVFADALPLFVDLLGTVFPKRANARGVGKLRENLAAYTRLAVVYHCPALNAPNVGLHHRRKRRFAKCNQGFGGPALVTEVAVNFKIGSFLGRRFDMFLLAANKSLPTRQRCMRIGIIVDEIFALAGCLRIPLRKCPPSGYRQSTN